VIGPRATRRVGAGRGVSLIERRGKVYLLHWR
jgi:hypothetical protein